MSITNIVPLSSRQYQEELNRGVTARRDWKVIVDDPNDDDSIVLAASGIPGLLLPHPNDGTSLVVRREATRRSVEWSEWFVSVYYSRQPGSTEDRQSPPTLRPVIRSASVRSVQMAVTSMKVADENSANGFKIVPITIKGTGTPLDPPLMITRYLPVVRFRRWESSFSTQTQRDYCGRVNKTPFGAYGPGEVMCTNIEGEEEYENDGNGTIIKYWHVTYEFAADTNGWQPRVVNADYFCINSDGNRVALHLDTDGAQINPPDGTPVSTPQILWAVADGQTAVGTMATSAEVTDAVADETFNDKFTFVPEIIPTADFNQLQLPVN